MYDLDTDTDSQRNTVYDTDIDTDTKNNTMYGLYTDTDTQNTQCTAQRQTQKRSQYTSHTVKDTDTETLTRTLTQTLTHTLTHSVFSVRTYLLSLVLSVTFSPSFLDCPPGQEAVACLSDVCRHARCPFKSYAKCRVNPCDGCRPEFRDDNNQRVNCSACKTYLEAGECCTRMWIFLRLPKAIFH